MALCLIVCEGCKDKSGIDLIFLGSFIRHKDRWLGRGVQMYSQITKDEVKSGECYRGLADDKSESRSGKTLQRKKMHWAVN